jgi:hypothetical protein
MRKLPNDNAQILKYDKPKAFNSFLQKEGQMSKNINQKS